MLTHYRVRALDVVSPKEDVDRLMADGEASVTHQLPVGAHA